MLLFKLTLTSCIRASWGLARLSGGWERTDRNAQRCRPRGRGLGHSPSQRTGPAEAIGPTEWARGSQRAKRENPLIITLNEAATRQRPKDPPQPCVRSD